MGKEECYYNEYEDEWAEEKLMFSLDLGSLHLKVKGRNF